MPDDLGTHGCGPLAASSFQPCPGAGLRPVPDAAAPSRAPARLGVLLSLVVHSAAVFGLLFAMAVPGGQDQAETVINVDFMVAPRAPEPEPAPEPALVPEPESAKTAGVPPPPEPPVPPPVPLPGLQPTPPPPEPVQPPPVVEKPAPPPELKKPAKAPRKRAEAKPTPAPPATVIAPRDLAASVPSVAIRSPAPTPSDSPVATRADLLHDYANRVWARVARHKPSGMIARGTAVVRFSLSFDGSLFNATIAKSSGIDTLDRASLAAVRAASPFPSPPPGASLEQLTFTVPFDYH